MSQSSFFGCASVRSRAQDDVASAQRACRRPRWFRVLLSLLCVAALAACAEASYYLQSVRGHAQVVLATEPIAGLLRSGHISTTLRQRLELAQKLRRFASAELGLPDNSSYQRYADLGRKQVVWNVVAAPAYSLELKTWCFPVVGCVAYRGYFEQASAQQMASELEAQGYDVEVYGVPAYSTLGWLNWLGGDPLLNTWIFYSDAELARLMFHELAHQALYVGSDTVFDESFATAVARLGTLQWLNANADARQRAQFDTAEQRSAAFKALTRQTRERLQQLYAGADKPGVDTRQLAAAKARVMDAFRQDYAALKASWGGYDGFDDWVRRANNASLGAQAAYDDLVAGFEALFQQFGGRWPDFFEAARALAQLPKAARTQALQEHAARAAGGP